jgi:hypothetical protein
MQRRGLDKKLENWREGEKESPEYRQNISSLLEYTLAGRMQKTARYVQS